MNYTVHHWILFFFIYCFLGWCIESTIVSIDTKKLTNRGFLRGPALPIYGFGAIMILFCTLPFEGNIIMQYIVGVVSCTVLEYFTGVLMEIIFKTKYWDYSNKHFNFQGRICLVSSLFWGVLTLFVVNVIHAPISKFVMDNFSTGFIITSDIILTIVFAADIYISAKAAFMLTKIAGMLEEASLQMELAKMQARDALKVKAEEFNKRIDDLSDSFRDADEEFKMLVADIRKKRTQAKKYLGYTVRSLVKNSPTSKHKTFEKGYSILKEYVEKFKD